MDQGSWQRYCSLIGEENLHLEYSELATEASFDISKRIITAPCFEFLDEETTQMLVSREVAHAKYSLYSPKKYREHQEKFHSLFDLAEQAYVEQKIKTDYKGLGSIFSHGYKKLYENGFYGLDGVNIATLPLISRLNLYCKIGHCIDVPFLNKEEIDFSIRINSLNSNRDVVKFCEDLLQYLQQEEMPQPKSSQSLNESENTEESSQKNESSESQQKEEEQNSGTETESEDSAEASEEESEQREESCSQQEDAEGRAEQDLDASSMEEDSEKESRSERDAEERRQETSSSYDGEQSDAENQEAEESQDESASQQGSQGRDGQNQLLEDFIEQQCKAKIRALGEELLSSETEDILSISTKEYAGLVCDLSSRSIVSNIGQRTKDRFVQLVKRLAVIVHTTFIYNKTAYEQKNSYHRPIGRIDQRKLFQYKTSNTIFKTRLYKQEGQSHGIIIMLDCSESMLDFIWEAKRL